MLKVKYNITIRIRPIGLMSKMTSHCAGTVVRKRDKKVRRYVII